VALEELCRGVWIGNIGMGHDVAILEFEDGESRRVRINSR
jgi:hypothetical protein